MKDETIAAIFGIVFMGMYFRFREEVLSLEAEKRIKHLQTKYDALYSEYIYNLEVASSKATVLEPDLETKKRELKEIIAKLNEIKQDPKHVISEARDRLLLDKKHLEEKLKELQKEFSTMALESETEKNKYTHTLKEKNKLLEIRENELKTAIKKIEILQSRLNELGASNIQLQQEHTRLQGRHSTLLTQYDLLIHSPSTAHKSEIERLLEAKYRGQENELKAANDALYQLHEKYTNKTQELTLKIDSLYEQNQVKEAVLSSTRREKEELAARYAKDKDSLEEKIRLLRNKLEIKREEDKKIPLAKPVLKAKL